MLKNASAEGPSEHSVHSAARPSGERGASCCFYECEAAGACGFADHIEQIYTLEDELSADLFRKSRLTFSPRHKMATVRRRVTRAKGGDGRTEPVACDSRVPLEDRVLGGGSQHLVRTAGAWRSMAAHDEADASQTNAAATAWLSSAASLSLFRGSGSADAG